MPFDSNHTQRAFRAYFRAGGTDQPSKYSGLRSHEGCDYVVLENVNGILAVYAVTQGGRLRALEEWPEALDPDGGNAARDASHDLRVAIASSRKHHWQR
jgi:hypothetical protein